MQRINTNDCLVFNLYYKLSQKLKGKNQIANTLEEMLTWFLRCNTGQTHQNILLLIRLSLVSKIFR